MKIFRSQIPSGRPLNVEEKVDRFDDALFRGTYPLLGIRDASLLGEVQKFDDIVVFRGEVAELLLADARTNEPFASPISFATTVNLLEEDLDGEEEGYLFPGNGIEVGEVLFALLRSETPLQPRKDDSPFEKKEGDGWVLTREGEEEGLPSPFDVLDGYSFDEE